MENKKEKLAKIFSTMKKKTKSDILAEFEEELIAAKNDGKTWKQLLQGLEQIGVTISEKTLTNFLKDKVDNCGKKNSKNMENKKTKTRKKVETQQPHTSEKKVVTSQSAPMPLFEK